MCLWMGVGAGRQTEEFKEEKTCFPVFQNDSFVRLYLAWQ